MTLARHEHCAYAILGMDDPPMRMSVEASPSRRWDAFVLLRCSACGRIVEAVAVQPDPIPAEGL